MSSSLHNPTLLWRKAARSSGSGNECVEVAALAALNTDDGTAVRDSKNPAGPMLAFSAVEWRAFTDRVKGGALDL